MAPKQEMKRKRNCAFWCQAQSLPACQGDTLHYTFYSLPVGGSFFGSGFEGKRLPLSFFGRDLKGMGGERLVYSSSLRFSSLTRSHWPNMGCPWKALPLERHSGMINKFNIPLLLSFFGSCMGFKEDGGERLVPNSSISSLFAIFKNEVTGRTWGVLGRHYHWNGTAG